MDEGARLRPSDKLVVASHNEGKVREIADLLAPFGLDASSPEFWHKGLKVIARMIDELEDMDASA